MLESIQSPYWAIAGIIYEQWWETSGSSFFWSKLLREVKMFCWQKVSICTGVLFASPWTHGHLIKCSFRICCWYPKPHLRSSLSDCMKCFICIFIVLLRKVLKIKTCLYNLVAHCSEQTLDKQHDFILQSDWELTYLTAFIIAISFPKLRLSWTHLARKHWRYLNENNCPLPEKFTQFRPATARGKVIKKMHH